MQPVQELICGEVVAAPRCYRGVVQEMTLEAAERTGVSIRPARPEDAPQAAHLMYLSAPSVALTIFGGGETNVVRIFGEPFPIPNHIYSYTHAFVAERGGSIAGLFAGFDRKTWEAAAPAVITEIGFRWFRIVGLLHLPRIISAAMDLIRAFHPPSDGEYIIHMLAVLPEMRRQGIGTQLVEYAAHQARCKGLNRLVLDVLIDNEGARRFYESVGFQAIKAVRDSRYCRRFGVKGSLRMAKPLT